MKYLDKEKQWNWKQTILWISYIEISVSLAWKVILSQMYIDLAQKFSNQKHQFVDSNSNVQKDTKMWLNYLASHINALSILDFSQQ